MALIAAVTRADSLAEWALVETAKKSRMANRPSRVMAGSLIGIQGRFKEPSRREALKP